MKNILFRITCFFLLPILLFSCQENNSSPELLIKAQKLAENNPVEALALLDSIPTENMDENSYMQYIIARVQAKYKNNQSIAEDTLIFKARDFFDIKGNSVQSALANFYSGGVYYQNKRIGESLKSYMKADYYANLSKDTILSARSLNNIGHLYYEQDVMDSAIFHYRLALDCYDRVKGADSLKMQTIHSIGTAFYSNYDLDSSNFYLNKGLDLAKITNNQKYQIVFTKNLGIIDRVRGNYKEGIGRLHSSLSQTTSSIDSLRIYFNLAKLYNDTEEFDSAHFYTDLLKNRLPEITDRAVLKGTYSSLLEYNKQIGNYIDALRYAELELKLAETIKAESQLKELFGADKEYTLEQKDKQNNQFKTQVCFWLIIGGVILASLLILCMCLFKLSKKHKKEIALQTKKYRNIKDQLITMGAEYKDIEAEIASILDDEADKE